MPRGGPRPGSGRKPGKVSEAKRTLAEMAKEHAPAALQALVDIAKRGESESARVSAASALLDRGFGKPPQAIEHSGPEGEPIQLAQPDNAELAKVLLGILHGGKG